MNVCYDHRHDTSWTFESPKERIVVSGNLTPAILDVICELLRNHGRVALIAEQPDELCSAKLVANLLHASQD